MQNVKGKATHPDQVKSSKRGKIIPRTHTNNRVLNDPQLDPDTQNQDILIADEYIAQNEGHIPAHPDEIGFYTFFLEEKGNPLIFWV